MVIQMHIAALDAEARHFVLSMLLDSCPFDPMYQLLIALLKVLCTAALFGVVCPRV